MIARSVQEEELAWYPQTMAVVETDIFYNKGVNVRF
jgi:hypothetical protein